MKRKIKQSFKQIRVFHEKKKTNLVIFHQTFNIQELFGNYKLDYGLFPLDKVLRTILNFVLEHRIEVFFLNKKNLKEKELRCFNKVYSINETS